MVVYTEPKYTTNLKFAQAMSLSKRIPNRDSSSTPVKETIGTGNGSSSIFYFDHASVLRNSETLYYGSSESTATSALTVQTHYNVNYDDGIITLTSTGVTLLNTSTLYSQYTYINSGSQNMLDSFLYDCITRAESYIDAMTNTVFYDSTLATPDFGIVSDEVHEGQGYQDKIYQLDKYPVNDTTTLLNGSLSAGATAITVISTNGFPDSGYIAIETNKITYTGKTTTEFTGCSDVTAHDTASIVTPFVIEISTDAEGTEPSYTVLEYMSDYDINFDSGHIRINNDDTYNTYNATYKPPYRVWNRIRYSYQYGYPSIYSDITHAVHLKAGLDLFSGQVLGSLSRGTDGFNTSSLSTVTDEINRIINKYKCILISDTKP